MWNAISVVFVNNFRNYVLTKGQKCVEMYKTAETNYNAQGVNSENLVFPIDLFDNLLSARGFISEG